MKKTIEIKVRPRNQTPYNPQGNLAIIHTDELIIFPIPLGLIIFECVNISLVFDFTTFV